MKRLFPAFLSSLFVVLICVCAAHAQSADDQVAEPDVRSKPKILQVSGTWTGTDDAVDGGSGDCNGCPMTLDITRQDAKQIGGTFSVTTEDEQPTGPMTGTVNGSTLRMTFKATSGTKHKCSAAVVATVDTSNDTMSGAWVTKGGKHCKGKGTFDLTLSK